jgi:hypothetical protein
MDRMPKKKLKKPFDEALLSQVKKEMAPPRAAESSRGDDSESDPPKRKSDRKGQTPMSEEELKYPKCKILFRRQFSNLTAKSCLENTKGRDRSFSAASRNVKCHPTATITASGKRLLAHALPCVCLRTSSCRATRRRT